MITALRRVPAVFLDKDGTLVEDVPYNADPARMRLLPGVIDGLSRRQQSGYRLIVVTNQSGVALGKFPEEAVGVIEAHLRELLRRSGVQLDGFYYCPHHPEGTVVPYCRPCVCRKPRPGLIHQAAQEWGIDLHRSWLVGDILNDVEAGRRAGCRTVLVDTGGETEWQYGPRRRPHFLVPDFERAAGCILRHRDVALVNEERHCA